MVRGANDPQGMGKPQFFQAPGMERFRHTMFSRLVPNLREIGLLTDRIRPHYERVGLMRYFDGRNALQISGESMLEELDSVPDAA